MIYCYQHCTQDVLFLSYIMHIKYDFDHCIIMVPKNYIKFHIWNNSNIYIKCKTIFDFYVYNVDYSHQNQKLYTILYNIAL